MKNGLSRREWIKCGFAGLALTAGHPGALSAVPQVSITPVQAAKNVDLVLRGVTTKTQRHKGLGA
jgi:hypothetical protein